MHGTQRLNDLTDVRYHLTDDDQRNIFSKILHDPEKHSGRPDGLMPGFFALRPTRAEMLHAYNKLSGQKNTADEWRRQQSKYLPWNVKLNGAMTEFIVRYIDAIKQPEIHRWRLPSGAINTCVSDKKNNKEKYSEGLAGLRQAVEAMDLEVLGQDGSSEAPDGPSPHFRDLGLIIFDIERLKKRSDFALKGNRRLCSDAEGQRALLRAVDATNAERFKYIMRYPEKPFNFFDPLGRCATVLSRIDKITIEQATATSKRLRDDKQLTCRIAWIDRRSNVLSIDDDVWKFNGRAWQAIARVSTVCKYDLRKTKFMWMSPKRSETLTRVMTMIQPAWINRAKEALGDCSETLAILKKVKTRYDKIRAGQSLGENDIIICLTLVRPDTISQTDDEAFQQELRSFFKNFPIKEKGWQINRAIQQKNNAARNSRQGHVTSDKEAAERSKRESFERTAPPDAKFLAMHERRIWRTDAMSPHEEGLKEDFTEVLN